ncbi:MAG: hypothetical protein IPO14_13000 [Saprospiraceae bacterium]|jgi:hypothetical protein|nr:hypothetical protein [Saprospiraceae bacterium]
MRNLLFVILFFAIGCKKECIKEEGSATLKMIVNFKSKCKSEGCEFSLFSGKRDGKFVYYTCMTASTCCGLPAYTIYDKNGKNERFIISEEAVTFRKSITEEKRLARCPQ